MEIKLRDWIAFRDRLRRLSDKATEEMLKWVRSRGGYAAIPREEIIEYAYALATKYGEASAALSADMYDAIAYLGGAEVPEAVVAETMSIGEVGKAMNGSMKFTMDEAYLSNVVGRFVKQTSQDTMLKNALRDGAEFAWIPAGDTCAFCLTLASRGWQKASKKAIKSGHAEHIHSNCDCCYAVRFDSKTNVEGYDPDKYLSMYESAEGRTPKDRINSMRREAYAADKKTEGSDNSELIKI
jgi:hypothetical protein